MRIQRIEGTSRFIFWVDQKSFQEIGSVLEAPERISYDVLYQKGYLNYILDFPVGRIIIALEQLDWKSIPFILKSEDENQN